MYHIQIFSNVCRFHSCKVLLAISLPVALLATVIASTFGGDLRLLLGDANLRIQFFLRILLCLLLADLINMKDLSLFTFKMVLCCFQHVQQFWQADVQFVHMIIND